MTERDDALKLAHRILDRPHADPDDDLAVLARQLIRARECVEIWRPVVEAAKALKAAWPLGYKPAPLGVALFEAIAALEQP